MCLCVCVCLEQYDEAIADLTECLDIQRELLAADDRRVAETRYQLGLACTFDKRYDAAVQHYRCAVDVIEAKMKQLSQVITGELPPSADVDPHGFDTPQQLAEKEMNELASIVPDILAKVRASTAAAAASWLTGLSYIPLGARQIDRS